MDLWQSLPDEVKATVLIVALAFGFIIGLALLGRLLTIRRPGSPLPLLMAGGGLAIIFIGTSVFLDRQPSVPGIVEGKQETLAIDSDASWRHNLLLTVRYTPPGESQPTSRELRADPASYDQAVVGESVAVRHLYLGGLFAFARISERTTLSVMMGSDTRLLGGLAAAAVVVFLVATQGKLRDVTAALILGALATLLYLGPITIQLRAAMPLGGRLASANATVVDVIRFTEIGDDSAESGREPVPQHLDLVQVSFVPAGQQDPVLSADLLDADSLSLEIGGRVPVRYRPDQPRSLRLQGGTRSYALKNTLWMVAQAITIILFLAALVGLSWWGRRKRKPGALGDAPGPSNS